jgi:hypothetical protein
MKDPLRAQKLRELGPHLEILVKHIEIYIETENSCSCFPKQIEEIEKIKLEFNYTLKRCYSTQNFNAKVIKVIPDIDESKVSI